MFLRLNFVFLILYLLGLLRFNLLNFLFLGLPFLILSFLVQNGLTTTSLSNHDTFVSQLSYGCWGRVNELVLACAQISSHPNKSLHSSYVLLRLYRMGKNPSEMGFYPWKLKFKYCQAQTQSKVKRAGGGSGSTHYRPYLRVLSWRFVNLARS